MNHASILCMISCVISVSGSYDPDATDMRVSVLNTTKGPQLEVLQTSATAGYIQTPGWSYLSLHPERMDSVVGIKIPETHTAMVTMVHLDLAGERFRCDESKVSLVLHRVRGRKHMVFWRCGRSAALARKQLPGGKTLYVHFRSRESPKVGFKLFFSVHSDSARLDEWPSGAWNCSVPYFEDFKPHFPCDLTPQCVGKEDERDCPYFSEECGPGFITMGKRRCAFFEKRVPSGTWTDTELRCSRRGGRLLNLRTRVDYDRLARFLQPMVDVWGFYRIFVGIHSTSPSMPMMYRNEFQHTDKNIAFYRSTRKKINVEFSCGAIVLSDEDRTSYKYITLVLCTKRAPFPSILCEIPEKPSTSAKETSPESIIRPRPVFYPNSSRLPPLVGCPHGHVTRDFLACDAASACWSRDAKSCPAPLTPLPPSFACANGFESVPYTLVCDVRPDCSDGSDESFCEFPPCDLPEPFYCSDRECLPRDAVCDRQRNCHNGVDEDLCSIKDIGFTFRPSPPAIVHLNRQGQFVVRKLNRIQTTDHSPEACPETHFHCPGNGYCMPVFLRCNGVYDCLGREDEVGCDSYTCPGFYRCRGSKVCLHPDHLCDDILQCPQNDDELLCEYNCSENCTCYGQAFYCGQCFPAGKFTKLRFLEGRGSGMKLEDFRDNVLLVYLSVAANGLTIVGEVNLPSLRVLDFSDNEIREFRLQDVSHVPKLEVLSLAGNPLLSLFQSVNRHGVFQRMTTESPVGNDVMLQLAIVSDRAGVTFYPFNTEEKITRLPNNISVVSSQTTASHSVLKSLRTLDLSRVKVETLNPSFLSLLPNLHTVNMSGCGVDTLLGEGFQALTQLRALDLRGCPLTYFPRHIFRGLQELQTVHSDNYKMCCPATLPAGFVLENCHAPFDDISSCKALLRSNSYRAILSIFAALSILGNASSFVYRVFLQMGSRLLSFDVFVMHLSVGDFLMGVYLSMIGVADRVYQGTYLWEDHTWKASPVCHMAGFLSLVSSEVSALIICLITIDRFLVLRFPLSTCHFGRRSAQVASLCVWGIGCLIATFPMLPGVAHWQFYSQTGICIPLPVSRADFPGYNYVFGVMIVANFVFFLVIAAGQFVVFWSVHASSLSVGGSTKKSQDVAIARRLITVAVSDFLCWFPIGVAGIVAATGTPISGEVNVAMAIFVLPINSALNPFLYTLNIVLEKRRKAQETRIKKLLAAQFRSLGLETKPMSSSGSVRVS